MREKGKQNDGKSFLGHSAGFSI